MRDILDDHGKVLKWQSARLKFDLHDKYFIVWSSLIKSIPVSWKRKIEAIYEDIGPAYYGNALPTTTFQNVYSRMLQPLTKRPLLRKRITFSQSKH